MNALKIRDLKIDELKELADTIRTSIITKTSRIGGNVASNLAVIEAIISLYKVFDMSNDRVIYDTSHYTYAHKFLTGRSLAFLNEEFYTSVTGYTNPEESEFDLFELGHTSTSLSLAYGLAKARDLHQKDQFVIAFIGEGSLGGGIALEGLQLAATIRNLILIINDNDQSIAENQGTIYNHLKILRETEGNAKTNIFKELGYNYGYVEDGNDITATVRALEDAKICCKEKSNAYILHINTIKGFGYEYAQKDPESWHWHAPYNIANGRISFEIKEDSKDVFAETIIREVESAEEKIVVITAGTPGYVGFDKSRRLRIKDNFVDVGICEQTAVAMAAGLAKGQCVPVFACQFSFLQRAYDQIYQEVALNNQHVIIVAFDSGIYGLKAKTHFGLCAIPMLNHIPNLTILAPNKDEFSTSIKWAIQKDSPVVLLAPTIDCIKRNLVDDDFNQDIIIMEEDNKSSISVALIFVSNMENIATDVAKKLKDSNIGSILIRPRVITPIHLDEEMLERLLKCKIVVTIEDGCIEGGLGMSISLRLNQVGIRTYVCGLRKQFVNGYNMKKILEENRLTPETIYQDIIKILEN